MTTTFKNVVTGMVEAFFLNRKEGGVVTERGVFSEALYIRVLANEVHEYLYNQHYLFVRQGGQTLVFFASTAGRPVEGAEDWDFETKQDNARWHMTGLAKLGRVEEPCLTGMGTAQVHFKQTECGYEIDAINFQGNGLVLCM